MDVETMRGLSPDARAILGAGRNSDDPSDEQCERVRNRTSVEAGIAFALGAGSVVAMMRSPELFSRVVGCTAAKKRDCLWASTRKLTGGRDAMTSIDSISARDDGEGRGTLREGSIVEGYQLLWPLGRGGMGEVWLAQVEGTLGLQKPVALKTISPAIANEARFRRLFLDEARVGAWISHPNVVPVFRVADAAGPLFPVTELVAG